ncbi:10695_t:CDS:2, partial [Cetraspora pellucida]
MSVFKKQNISDSNISGLIEINEASKKKVLYLDVLNDKECRRTYKTGSLTSNLIEHLSTEHGITKSDQNSKK